MTSTPPRGSRAATPIAVAVGLVAIALAGASPAAGVSLSGLSVQQLPAGTRYAATVLPTEAQSGCEVTLTAELLRAQPRRAPRVVRRTTSSTDVCATGEEGTTFTTVRASGIVGNRGLGGGRYVLRLRADAQGAGGVLLSNTASRRTLLRVLVIRPVRVRRGGGITIVGAGWPARTSVLLAVGRPRTSPGDTIARVRTTARGTFTRRAPISARAAPGPYVGIALLRNGEKSSARFRIV